MITLERRNAYFCRACKITTITVDIDNGTTPMFILCPHCGCSAVSFMYQLPGALHLRVEAEYEWYKPSERDALNLSKDEADHVFRGGLLMRKRTKAKPLMREIKTDQPWQTKENRQKEPPLSLTLKTNGAKRG